MPRSAAGAQAALCLAGLILAYHWLARKARPDYIVKLQQLRPTRLLSADTQVTLADITASIQGQATARRIGRGLTDAVLEWAGPEQLLLADRASNRRFHWSNDKGMVPATEQLANACLVLL